MRVCGDAVCVWVCVRVRVGGCVGGCVWVCVARTFSASEHFVVKLIKNEREKRLDDVSGNPNLVCYCVGVCVRACPKTLPKNSTHLQVGVHDDRLPPLGRRD